MGRPKTYADDTIVCINATEARTRLRPDSERRAIVNRVIDAGGRMKMSSLDKAFGYNIRGIVAALITAGWLVAEEQVEE